MATMPTVYPRGSYPRFPQAANEHPSIHPVEHATPDKTHFPLNVMATTVELGGVIVLDPSDVLFSFLIPYLHHLCSPERWQHEDLGRAHLSPDLCMTPH